MPDSEAIGRAFVRIVQPGSLLLITLAPTNIFAAVLGPSGVSETTS
jgi:hypothetical protein